MLVIIAGISRSRCILTIGVMCLVSIFSGCGVKGSSGTAVSNDQGVFDVSGFPAHYSLTRDKSQLVRGKSVEDNFYSVREPQDFHLNFDSDTWIEDLCSKTFNVDNFNKDVSAIAYSAVYNGNTYDQVAVGLKGLTSMAGSGLRKSFNISLDKHISGQDIDGYNSLNFNNSFSDESYMREVFYVNRSRLHMPAAGGNFINLYVNGQFWGLYSNIQQLNKDFIKEWFANTKGTSWRAFNSNPNVGNVGGDGEIPTLDYFDDGGFDFPDVDFELPDDVFFPDDETEDGVSSSCISLFTFNPPDLSDGSGSGQEDDPFVLEGGDSGPPGTFAVFGEGTSTLNYLGDETAPYEEAYQLRKTKSETPWQSLIAATKSLDSITADNIQEVSKIIDIDGALWFLAHEILFNDDDSYINKGGMDYEVYFDVATGRLLPFERDGNEVMNMEIVFDVFYRSSNPNYPLAYKLFNIPELRQRYLAHVRTLLNESFDPEVANPILDQYRSLIDAGVANDPHPHEGTSYEGLDDAVTEIRKFIASRYELLTMHSEVAQQAPVINDVSYSVDNVIDARPSSSESVVVKANVTHNDDIDKVYGYYGTGMAGTFNRIEMVSDDSGLYSMTVPAQVNGSLVRYYIEAIAVSENGEKQGALSYSPAGAEHDVYVYRVKLDTEASTSIVINEVMASNESTAMDENGDYDDWLELYNTSNQTVNLSGYSLSDDLANREKWAFPDVSIAGGEYLIIWADDDQGEGSLHTNFKLSSSGEDLLLINPEGKLVDAITLPDDFEPDQSLARIPNGKGIFTRTDPSYRSKNQVN